MVLVLDRERVRNRLLAVAVHFLAIFAEHPPSLTLSFPLINLAGTRLDKAHNESGNGLDAVAVDQLERPSSPAQWEFLQRGKDLVKDTLALGGVQEKDLREHIHSNQAETVKLLSVDNGILLCMGSLHEDEARCCELEGIGDGIRGVNFGNQSRHQREELLAVGKERDDLLLVGREGPEKLSRVLSTPQLHNGDDDAVDEALAQVEALLNHIFWVKLLVLTIAAHHPQRSSGGSHGGLQDGKLLKPLVNFGGTP